MSKFYCSLGLMSGTSADGVDASIIQSDGDNKYEVILDKYFEYPKNIFKNLTIIRNKIKSLKDLKKYQKQIKSIEKQITIFHAQSVNKILNIFSILLIFLSISFLLRIFLVSSLPDGSPIRVVPPPSKTIGWWPYF